MKLTNLSKKLLFFLIGISLFSCKEDESVPLLQKAQSRLAENKPDVAFNIISSIQNPQSLDESNYMKYIVIYVGAKYETGQDIKGDSSIIEAQQYFNKKGKSEESALANYYTAQLYDVNANFPKALESYMYAVSNAEKSKNNLLVGKSLNNIGYIYFQQELFGTAISNYQSALSYYNKAENADRRKLKTLTNIGWAYKSDNRYDSVYVYFNKALEGSIKSGDELYKSHSLQNLGVAYYEMGEYDKAIDYLKSALAMSITKETEIRQIHLSLLKATTRSGDLKSAKQYADSVIIDLPQVTNEFTTQAMYGALADYYRQTKDFEKALDYKYLEASTNKQIDSEINVPAILEVDKKFHLDQQSSDFFAFKSDAILFGIIGVIIFISIIVLGFFMYRTHKKDEEEFNREIAKYNRMRQILRDDDNEHYAALEAEIKAMLEEED